MKTLIYPRRVMRPCAAKDDMPSDCKWCGQAIGRGEVFTRGTDLGKDAVVCSTCLTPPQLGQRPSELTVDD